MTRHLDYIDLTRVPLVDEGNKLTLIPEKQFVESLKFMESTDDLTHVRQLFADGITLPGYPIKVSIPSHKDGKVEVLVHSNQGVRKSSYERLVGATEEGMFWQDFWRQAISGLEYNLHYSQTEDDFDFAEAFTEELPDDVKTVYKYLAYMACLHFGEAGDRDEYILSLGEWKLFCTELITLDDEKRKQVFRFRYTPDGLEMVHRDKAYRMHVRQHPVTGMLVMLADRTPVTKLSREQYANVCDHFLRWLQLASHEFPYIRYSVTETHYFALPTLDEHVINVFDRLWELSLDESAAVEAPAVYHYGDLKLKLAIQMDKSWTFSYSHTTGNGVEMDLGRFSLIGSRNRTNITGVIACMEQPIPSHLKTAFYRMMYQLIIDLSPIETPPDERNEAFFEFFHDHVVGKGLIDWKELIPAMTKCLSYR